MKKVILLFLFLLSGCSYQLFGYNSSFPSTYLAGDICMRLGLVDNEDLYQSCYNSVIKTLVLNERL